MRVVRTGAEAGQMCVRACVRCIYDLGFWVAPESFLEQHPALDHFTSVPRGAKGRLKSIM